MSVKSDKTFKPTKKLYLEWIEETYGITIKDIEDEFIHFNVLGNSILGKFEAELLGKKLGLFGRKYTSVTALAEEYKMSRSKVSSLINDIYLKISIKNEVKKVK